MRNNEEIELEEKISTEQKIRLRDVITSSQREFELNGMGNKHKISPEVNSINNYMSLSS
jgi:hypothetical protein